MRGWAGPVTEISVFATDISVTGMKVFPHEHFSPLTRTKLFKQNSVTLTTYRPKWHNFGLVCISSLGVCKLALLVKLQDGDGTRIFHSWSLSGSQNLGNPPPPLHPRNCMRKNDWQITVILFSKLYCLFFASFGNKNTMYS